MPDSSDGAIEDYAAFLTCADGSMLAPESEGYLRQTALLSCEVADHRYVIDIVQSEATLACLRCDFSEYIGAWHPK